MGTLLEDALEVADRLGSCNPLWLQNGEKPEFLIEEANNGKPPILLLHGLLGALSNWGATLPFMAQYSNPMALQFPLLTGHRSEVKIKSLAVYSWYLIKQRKLEPMVLCGNSLGGHVALRLYLAAPETVDCLILAGTSGLYEHSVDTLPVRPAHDFIRDHMARVFVNRDFINEEAVEEIYKVMKDRKNVLNLIHAARSAKRDNLLHYLKEIKVPTLLLWGEQDEITSMTVAETFHKHIPNSKLVTIDKCGHAPMIEHPEWFAEEVQKFLAENSPRFKKTK